MIKANRKLYVIAACIFTSLHGSAAMSADEGWQLDPLSYSLGNFSTFAEVVNIGIKKMALSNALPAAKMDDLEREAMPIARERGVEVYREAAFLVTDLFPASATEDKDVLIIYKDTTLDEYMALKEKKTELVTAGNYEGDPRREIAWAMGKLLSYPDEKIKQLLGE
jgi:hypothetical protein